MQDEDLARLTVRWEEDGVLVVDELDRRVLSAKGGWATVAFLARERDRGTGALEAPKLMLRRYRKRARGFEVTAKITLPFDQADALVDAITAWRARVE